MAMGVMRVVVVMVVCDEAHGGTKQCAQQKKEELSVPFQVSLQSKGTTSVPGAIGNSYEAALPGIKTPKPN